MSCSGCKETLRPDEPCERTFYDSNLHSRSSNSKGTNKTTLHRSVSSHSSYREAGDGSRQNGPKANKRGP